VKLTVNVTLFSFITASKTVTCQAIVMIHTAAAKEAEILTCPAPVINIHYRVSRLFFFTHNSVGQNFD
jgi:hypothetical protein